MLGTTLRFALILGLVGSLAACGGVRDRLVGARAMDVGLPFNATLRDGDTPRDFTVEVDAAGASLPEARESARFPATRHCIDRFGLSDVNWTMDPATGDWAVTRTEDGGLIVSGSCVGR